MQNNSAIHFDSFLFDPTNCELWREGRLVPLTPKALEVLRYLLLHPGRLVTKSDLLDAIWSGSHVGEAVLKVCILEIRKALGDVASSPRYIQTIHRRGYRFIGNARPRPPDEKGPSLSGVVEKSAVFPNLQVPPATVVGREAAFSELKRHFHDALDGKRQVVFITGESGIGKTTTLNHFLEYLQSKTTARIARGQCLQQYGESEAFMPVLEALSRLCRDSGGNQVLTVLRRMAPTWLAQVPALAADERESLRREILGATPERMLREITEALETLAQEQLLVVALEDLHWSDYSTLDLISFLARRPEEAHIMVLGTYRPVDVVLSQHPLRLVRQELEIHRHCVGLPLEFLTEGAVSEYLTRRLYNTAPSIQLARWIHQRTDGNPLFMVNLVDYLIEQKLLAQEEGEWNLSQSLETTPFHVPENLRQMIENQIQRLSVDEQRILETASVVGSNFSAAAVAAGSKMDPVEVEECCDALARRGYLLSTDDLQEMPDGTWLARFRFIHSLYQHVLYQQVPEARRIRLHQCVGEFLESAYKNHTAEVAPELAIHFEQARDFARAVRYFHRAAENAAERYANREAIDYLTRALAWVHKLTGQDQSVTYRNLMEQLAFRKRSMGNMKGAAEDFEALASHAREQNSVDDEVTALFQLSMALSWVDPERCWEISERAVKRSAEIQNQLLQADARGSAAYSNLLLRGWQDRDLQASAEAVQAAREAENLTLLSLHLGRYSYFQCLRSEYREACQTAKQGQKVALQIGSAFDYMLSHFFEAWALLQAGEWGAMLATLNKATEMAKKNSHQLWLILYELELAWLHEQALDFERASELCLEGLRKCKELRFGYGELMSSVLMGLAESGLGKHEKAIQTFNAISRRMDREHLLMKWIWEIPLALGQSRCWLARGDYDKARVHARRVVTLAASPRERTWMALGLNGLAEVALHEDDFGTAEQELAEAVRMVRAAEIPLAEWRVHCTGARICERQNRPEEAKACWTRCAKVLRKLMASLGDSERLRNSLARSSCLPESLRQLLGDVAFAKGASSTHTK